MDGCLAHSTVFVEQPAIDIFFNNLPDKRVIMDHGGDFVLDNQGNIVAINT
jgi:hypothetical protein